MGDLNGHHQKWLGPTTTNRHGVAAFDFSTVSGCDQLVAGPTHARGGTLELLMSDVLDLVWVTVVAPIGNSARWHYSRIWIGNYQPMAQDGCVIRGRFQKMDGIKVGTNTASMGYQCVNYPSWMGF